MNWWPFKKKQRPGWLRPGPLEDEFQKIAAMVESDGAVRIDRISIDHRVGVVDVHIVIGGLNDWLVVGGRGPADD